VPDLYGLTVEQAQAVMRKAGFERDLGVTTQYTLRHWRAAVMRGVRSVGRRHARARRSARWRRCA
jgi:hypothetical protein